MEARHMQGVGVFPAGGPTVEAPAGYPLLLLVHLDAVQAVRDPLQPNRSGSGPGVVVEK